VATEWDRGNAHFPPTTFQVSNLNAGTGAENVIPGELTAWLNFRFSTEVDAPTLQRRVEAQLDQAGLTYELEWRLSGNPFLTPAGELVDAARAAVRTACGYDTELSTSGGTSDGRFIAPTGAQVLELGPRNATIHQIDECVGLDELDALHAVYLEVLRRLL
jgi:succinyl-diaminopimelate desuccinylase